MSIHLWKPSYFRGALNFASEFFFPKERGLADSKDFFNKFSLKSPYRNWKSSKRSLYNQPKIIRHVHLTGLKP